MRGQRASRPGHLRVVMFTYFIDFLAALDELEGRHSADFEPLSKLRLLVHINLDEFDMGELPAQLTLCGIQQPEQ